MLEIVIASGNKGKIAEIKSVLADQSVKLLTKSDFNIEDPEETGLSFVENAILKARFTSEISGKPSLADDSGLVVNALDGDPGIFSSRYAGINASDEENVEKLLQSMQQLKDNERSAYFYCAIAFVLHAKDPTPLIAEARWQGQITASPSGSGGFGYDPVFCPLGHECTAAELETSLKNSISHRAQALIKFSDLSKEYNLFN